MNCRPYATLCLCALVAAVPRAVIAQEPATLLTASTKAAPMPADVGPRGDVPGFLDLFKPLKNDFRRMASPENLVLMQAGVFGALTFAPWDRRLASTAWGQGTVGDALQPGKVVGGMIAQSSAAVATYAIGRATGQARIARLGADLVRAQIVAQATTQAIKLTSQRTRPDGTPLSFPSGHTSSSFATATVLNAHFGWKAGIPAYAMASWVAASRVQMKKHHVSDVIVGATVGLLAGRSVTFGYGGSRFSVGPMAVPGGAGVSVVRLGDR